MKKINFKTGEQGLLFVTFGSGVAWQAATMRLANQAKKFGRGEALIIFDECDLVSVNSSIVPFAKLHPKGFGLWKWKPLIIQEVFRLYPNVRTVIYLDAGCELNRTKKSLNRFDEYLEIAAVHGGLGFELPHLEIDWTNPELFSYFSRNEKRKQLVGGILFLQNNLVTKKVLEEWDYWMNFDDSRLLIGPSIEDELPKYYKEHRYDQSIISLIWHKNNLPTISDETFWEPQWKKKGRNYPIWAARNRLQFSYRHNRLFIILFKIFNKVKNR